MHVKPIVAGLILWGQEGRYANTEVPGLGFAEYDCITTSIMLYKLQIIVVLVLPIWLED